MTFSSSLGPRQRRIIRDHGSTTLQSLVQGSVLRAPDAGVAWAHLSDVRHGARLDPMDERSIARLTETALRHACKERNR